VSQKRKEQNRKAQKNHRIRSQAKLEQLQVQIREKVEEIAHLQDVNQSLSKQLDDLLAICNGRPVLNRRKTVGLYAQ
jgi:hypothetical protein